MSGLLTKMDILFRTLRQNKSIVFPLSQYYLMMGFPKELPRMIRETEARLDFMSRISNYHTTREIETVMENLRFMNLIREHMSPKE